MTYVRGCQRTGNKIFNRWTHDPGDWELVGEGVLRRGRNGVPYDEPPLGTYTIYARTCNHCGYVEKRQDNVFSRQPALE